MLTVRMNVCVPPLNSYVESLTPREMALGEGIFGGVVGIDVMRVRLPDTFKIASSLTPSKGLEKSSREQRNMEATRSQEKRPRKETDLAGRYLNSTIQLHTCQIRTVSIS